MKKEYPRRDGITAGAAGNIKHLKFIPPSLRDQVHRDLPLRPFLLDAGRMVVAVRCSGL
jgi:hypothetical protein